MKTVYIDDDFKCHVNNLDGNYRAVETDFFDGKCAEFIEGYRYVPSGESWTGEDGIPFIGEMIAPWRDYNKLDEAQRTYERELIAEYESTIIDMETALNRMGVTKDENMD